MLEKLNDNYRQKTYFVFFITVCLCELDSIMVGLCILTGFLSCLLHSKSSHTSPAETVIFSIVLAATLRQIRA